MTQNWPTFKLGDLASVRSSIISEGQTSSRSSFTRKIQRKKSQRSLSKRSRGSEESSDLTLSGFYTKMQTISQQKQLIPKDNRLSSLAQGLVTVIKKRSPTPATKKRSPTPAHSRIKRIQQSDHHSGDIELQLKIAELQRGLDGERVQRVAAQRRAGLFEKKFKEKIREMQEWEAELSGVRGSGSDIRFSEGEVRSVGGTLGMMKKNMKMVRTEQFQQKISTLLQQNDSLKQSSQNLKLQNQNLRQQCQTLRQQIYNLSQQSQSFLLQGRQKEIQYLRTLLDKSVTERQKELRQLLCEVERNRGKLLVKMGKLELKVDFMNRKKNEEIQMVANRKDRDIANIRRKLSLLAKQTLELKRGLIEQGERKKGAGRRWSQDSYNSVQFSISPQRE